MRDAPSGRKPFCRSFDEPNGDGWKLPPFSATGDEWTTPSEPSGAGEFAKSLERNVNAAYRSIRGPFWFSRIKAVEGFLESRWILSGWKIFEADGNREGGNYEAKVLVFSTENGTETGFRKISGVVGTASARSGSEVSLFFRLSDWNVMKWTADSFTDDGGVFHAFSKIRKLKGGKCPSSIFRNR